jgi:predicted DNA-binding antitoxin AbrB/MazE fold protein
MQFRELLRGGEKAMTQIVNATFDQGVLRPETPVRLSPGERVRIVIESLSGERQESSHEEAWEEFDKLCDEAPIHSGGEHLTRDQLHERR